MQYHTLSHTHTPALFTIADFSFIMSPCQIFATPHNNHCSEFQMIFQDIVADLLLSMLLLFEYFIIT